MPRVKTKVAEKLQVASLREKAELVENASNAVGLSRYKDFKVDLTDCGDSWSYIIKYRGMSVGGGVMSKEDESYDDACLKILRLSHVDEIITRMGMFLMNN